MNFLKGETKSAHYSQKLYKRFKAELKTAALKPEIGIKTKLDQVRGLIIGDYILFYEILDDKILVLKVWDCRQNPDKLEIMK